MKKISQDEFIQKAKLIHGDKYDYSLVLYINSQIKVKIICKEHGVFEQLPNNHICREQGCPVCSCNKKSSTEEFIKKSKNIHGDKYDYSLVKYTGFKNKIKIICPIHGILEVSPGNLYGQGCCKKCGKMNVTSNELPQH